MLITITSLHYTHEYTQMSTSLHWRHSTSLNCMLAQPSGYNSLISMLARSQIDGKICHTSSLTRTQLTAFSAFSTQLAWSFFLPLRFINLIIIINHYLPSVLFAFSALMLLVGWQEEYLACKKNCVVRCRHGYVSGSRCRFVYGPANATAIHYLLLQ